MESGTKAADLGGNSRTMDVTEAACNEIEKVLVES
jgi:hypothetical protein